jgi:hypothetical protein
MNRVQSAAILAVSAFALSFSATTLAVSPDNPSFEDDNLDPLGWTVANDGDFTGAGWVVDDEDATDGQNFGRLSFVGCCVYGGDATGPAFQSSTFQAGAGEEISVDWRVTGTGGFVCGGDPNSGDTAIGTGYLVNDSDDTIAATFFDQSATCGTDWDTAIVNAPAVGDYYLEFRVASFDATDGGVVGAQMDIDNVTANAPPDCNAASADKDMLWPPNHKFHDISVVGVTDPEGDAITIYIDAVRQDEWTNGDDDGNVCPDAMGIGTDTASVAAERVGGPEGSEGNGRYYWISFTAEDEFGGTCSDVVKVSVPHNKQVPAVDNGPLFDSTSCP